VKHFEIGFYSDNPVKKDDLCIIMNGKGELYLPPQEENSIPFFPLFRQGYGSWTKALPYDAVYLGSWDGRACYAVNIKNVESRLDKPTVMRSAMAALPEEYVCLICMGKQLLYWREHTNYCGVCGTKLQEKAEVRARVCPKCGYLHFPKINPAVITAICKDDKLLLAHNAGFQNNTYSLIAGYVESGETLEQSVTREIHEEVNINVKKVRYWGSQPWPFPGSLMCGFTAEYDSGELIVDGREIVDAEWYSVDALPTLPRPGSIARKIIDDWISKVHA